MEGGTRHTQTHTTHGHAYMRYNMASHNLLSLKFGGGYVRAALRYASLSSDSGCDAVSVFSTEIT